MSILNLEEIFRHTSGILEWFCVLCKLMSNNLMFGLNKLTYIIDVSLMAQHFNKQWSNKQRNNKERKSTMSIGLFNSTWPLDFFSF